MSHNRYRAVLCDLDGTTNRGKTPIPGAANVVQNLTEKNVRWVYLSNNATILASHMVARIKDMGFPVSEDQVVNSASVLIHTLKSDRSDAVVLVVGEPPLIEGIRAARITVTEDPSAADIVVTAMDRGFSYDKLKRAQNAIHRGALFWATNQDASLPVEDGVLPGAGSIVAAVSVAAGKQPDRVFGKPSPDMALLALEMLGLEPTACLVVGDRMETDILLAKNAGMDSALVLTGATSSRDLINFPFTPDHVLESIADLPDLFD